MNNLTHWKKLHNPDYLGAYALNPGEDLTLTIKQVKSEIVTGPDGKKEECMVMYFSEQDTKPMIMNSTNSKTCAKIFKTPYIEQWTGRKVSIYIANIKAFGQTVEALRVRPFSPKITEDKPICMECKKEISAFNTMNPIQMATYTQKKYGKPLCAECAEKIATAQKEQNGDIL